MDRLHRFFVALEYLAICEFSVKDGPITYIQELQAFRRETPDLFRLFWADKFFRTTVARLTIVDRCTSSPRHSCTRSWVDPGPIGSGLSVIPAGSKQPALRLPLLPVKASGSLAQFLKTLRSLRRQVSLCRSSRRPSVFEAQETEEYRSSS